MQTHYQNQCWNIANSNLRNKLQWNLKRNFVLGVSVLNSQAVGKSLTHWGRVTHTSASKLTIIGSDNGLSPDRRQAIIWTNAGLLLIGPLGTNFSEILIEILTFSFKKMRLKVSSAKRWPFCLGLNVLNESVYRSSWCCWDFDLHEECPFHNHDDVIKWKHFPRCWPLVRWIPLTKTGNAQL